MKPSWSIRILKQFRLIMIRQTGCISNRLTFEDVINIIQTEKPKGVIVQFGGQTPLKLAVPLEKAGVPILGNFP